MAKDASARTFSTTFIALTKEARFARIPGTVTATISAYAPASVTCIAKEGVRSSVAKATGTVEASPSRGASRGSRDEGAQPSTISALAEGLMALLSASTRDPPAAPVACPDTHVDRGTTPDDPNQATSTPAN